MRRAERVRVLSRQACEVGPDRWRVPSSRLAGVAYLVRRGEGGWRCSCIGFGAHHRCVHADAVALRTRAR